MWWGAIKRSVSVVLMVAAGASGGVLVMRHQSAEAQRRRAIAELCAEGATLYLRCAGAECSAATEIAGVVSIARGKVYRLPLEGAALAWSLTTMSTKSER